METYFEPLGIMRMVYAKVFIIARGQVRQITQLVRQTVRMFQRFNSRDPRLTSDTKVSSILASVVTAFTICWIPYFVLVCGQTFPVLAGKL